MFPENWGGQAPNVDESFLFRLVTTVLIILALAALRFLVLRVAGRRIDDSRILYRWQKITGYAAFFLGVVLLGGTWVKGFGALSTFLGLLSAGVAIALRDPIVDLGAVD